MFQALMEGLFPNHQYGQESTIGTIDHLKNPSLKKMKEIGREEVNKYNMYIRFICTPENTV